MPSKMKQPQNFMPVLFVIKNLSVKPDSKFMKRFIISLTFANFVAINLQEKITFKFMNGNTLVRNLLFVKFATKAILIVLVSENTK